MKKTLLVFLLLAAAIAFAQPTPMPTPSQVVVPVPSGVLTWAAAAFAVGGMIYKSIDGLKNLIPALNNNPLTVKILNFAGSFLVLGAGCFVANTGPMDALDLLKCFIAAVIASLTAAGFYEAKKNSDIARAGGAQNLANAKAVAEVVSNAPVPPGPPEPPVAIPGPGPKKGKA
jgi:hypothetical protein